MSNSVMNAHIEFGSPCGDGAGLEQVADWAGDQLIKIRAALERIASSDVDLAHAIANRALYGASQRVTEPDDGLPVNHDEARELAEYRRSSSNLARCYLDQCAKLEQQRAHILLLEELLIPFAAHGRALKEAGVSGILTPINECGASAICLGAFEDALAQFDFLDHA